MNKRTNLQVSGKPPSLFPKAKRPKTPVSTVLELAKGNQCEIIHIGEYLNGALLEELLGLRTELRQLRERVDTFERTVISSESRTFTLMPVSEDTQTSDDSEVDLEPYNPMNVVKLPVN